MITRALVYARTYSRNSRPLERMWLMIAAEERDVAPGADRHVDVGHRARAREARVDVHDLRAALLGLDHPLKADRVLLGHVRAHDEDRVGVLEVLLEGGGAAAPERGPQTGDRARVSYARLVLD